MRIEPFDEFWPYQLPSKQSKCIEPYNAQSEHSISTRDNEQCQAPKKYWRPMIIRPKITRCGRGTRRNYAYWKERNENLNADLFDGRELLFGNKHGALEVSRLANLDTQLKIRNGSRDDLIMSSQCARELGVLDEISTDFEDPCLQSISGHLTAVKGILRNVQFRLRESSATFSGDFWVCDAIDGFVDVMIGANFITENFKTLFKNVIGCASNFARNNFERLSNKVEERISMFATWFSRKKETPEQKREREEQERQQKTKVNALEMKRLQREKDMHQRVNGHNSDSGGSVHQGIT
ncbi:uncharacterized protein F4807DRAFT_407623 [Annulohypoxylon truncatum]|uniref:uncharacterized protein n=1 Tax=Annulohypoxylon truncatum TaxID=327061 RepID=UPI0020086F3F|nr:uncharacterized protein F4807DRAFT_407623 [Annulohypoxylon truncatum]KAI1214348.1 hypothetical protein F4807DRAFT_407623 [Annulohypoxylon truncatum]